MAVVLALPPMKTMLQTPRKKWRPRCQVCDTLKVSVGQKCKHPFSEATNMKFQKRINQSVITATRKICIIQYYLSLARVIQTEISDELIYHPRRLKFHVGLVAGISAQTATDYKKACPFILRKPLSQSIFADFFRALNVALHFCGCDSRNSGNKDVQKHDQILYVQS
jgi:hypothetical protein